MVLSQVTGNHSLGRIAYGSLKTLKNICAGEKLLIVAQPSEMKRSREVRWKALELR